VRIPLKERQLRSMLAQCSARRHRIAFPCRAIRRQRAASLHRIAHCRVVDHRGGAALEARHQRGGVVVARPLPARFLSTRRAGAGIGGCSRVVSAGADAALTRDSHDALATTPCENAQLWLSTTPYASSRLRL